MSTFTPPPVPPSGAPLVAAKKTPGLAVASLVLGILSMMGAAVLLVPTVLAIVFGHVSYSKIQKDPSLGGSGIALAGMILGYVSILFGIMSAGLLAAMAIPAFQKVRENALEKTMMNDARMIGSAAQHIFLEKGEHPIVFHIDPQTGAVSGPLAEYVKQVTKGTGEVDGVIENAHDSFSLQNPLVHRGHEVVFDAEGHMMSGRTQ